MKDDPTGALYLRRWAAAVQSGAASSTVIQRVVHPGLTPLSGSGIFGMVPAGRAGNAGESPQSVSIVHIKTESDGGLGADANERDPIFGALLTLASNRRFLVTPEVPLRLAGKLSTLLVPMNFQVDPDLSAPPPAFGRINNSVKEYIARLSTMDETDAEAISAAIRLHYNSTLLYDRDLAGAYALAVGGVEALAAQFGPAFAAWEDWDKAESWEKFFAEQALSESQVEALKARLLSDQHVRLTEKFTRYFCENLPADFWLTKVKSYTWGIDADSGLPIDGAWSAPVARDVLFASDSEALRRAVKRAYQRRSTYIHAGKHVGNHLTEFFGDGPGRVRKVLSYAQLRNGLRELIIKEIRARGSAGLKKEQLFVADLGSPGARGAAFFMHP